MTRYLFIHIRKCKLRHHNNHSTLQFYVYRWFYHYIILLFNSRVHAKSSAFFGSRCRFVNIYWKNTQHKYKHSKYVLKGLAVVLLQWNRFTVCTEWHSAFRTAIETQVLCTQHTAHNTASAQHDLVRVLFIFFISFTGYHSNVYPSSKFSTQIW